MKRTTGEKVLDIIILVILVIVLVTTLYPFIYAFAIAFNDGIDAARGGIYLFPRKFTLDNFKVVFTNNEILRAFVVSVSRTIIGTIATLLFTGLFAYSMSHDDLVYRSSYMRIMLFSMYFSGGLIPYSLYPIRSLRPWPFIFTTSSIRLISPLWEVQRWTQGPVLMHYRLIRRRL